MPKSDSLFQIFINEHISVVTDLSLSVAPGEVEDMDGVAIPLTFQGYLLDLDDEFLYLGETNTEVDKAIKRESVVFIQISKQEDELSRVYDEMKKRNKMDIN